MTREEAKMTDLISRADAIDSVKDTILKRFNLADWYEEMLNFGVEIEDRIKALPSADANPTIVRCKTMIPYGDFREWAKRIREDNPNVIVIPFDAEVASADADCSTCKHKDKDWDSEECDSCCGNNNHYASAEAGWIPCSERLPDVGEIVIASWSDLWSDAIVFARRYCEDDWEWAYEQGSDYWESARDYDRESNPEAWMPLPTPYKGGDDE